MHQLTRQSKVSCPARPVMHRSEPKFAFLRLAALFLALVVSLFHCRGDIFSPVITNFTDRDYHAAFQNWDATQDTSGTMFFANGQGLLSFDGYRWKCVPLPGKTILRSVFSDNGRIYAGTYDAFGYFRQLENGNFEFIDISTPMKQGNVHRNNEEIWKIQKWNDRIIFQSFLHIYVYDPATETLEMISETIADPADDGTTLRPLFCYAEGPSLFAQNINGHFYLLGDDGKWYRYWTTDRFGSHIMGLSLPPNVSPLKNRIPDGSLLFTINSYIYRVENGVPKRMFTDIDPDLSDSQINRVLDASDGTIYIGTIGKGVFHIKREGELIDRYDTSRGLNNNTVLGLEEDTEGNVWATLDDGIALLYASLPLKMVHSFSLAENKDIGMVYATGFHEGKIVIATNQGAYIQDSDNRFSLLPGQKGQNWFVKEFGPQTFIGGNDRTVILEKDGSLTFLPISGTDIKQAVIHNNEVLVQTNYNDLHIYRKNEQSQWEYSNIVNYLDEPVRQVEIDSDGTLWCSHWTSGVMHLSLNPSLTEITSKDVFYSLTPDNNHERISVLKIRGKIYFTSGSEIYFFDEPSNTFMKAQRMESLNLLSEIRSAVSIDDNRFWMVCADTYNLIEYTPGKGYSIVYTVPIDLFPRKNNGDNSMVKMHDGKAYFTLNGGIGRVDTEAIAPPLHGFPLAVHAVSSSDGFGKTTVLPVSAANKTELKNDNLTVELSYPNYNRSDLRFRFELHSGNNVFDTITPVPVMSYPELSWGEHLLHCEVLDANNNILGNADYLFEVRTPWFVRWYAIVSYILIVIALTWLMVSVIETRKKRKRQLEFEKQRDIRDKQIREQELMIAEQQKRILESELSEKSKELASMALGEYGRRQAVENIKASLSDLKTKGDDISVAQKVMNEFAKNDGDTRVFWDVFEKNFDLIHEHFFKNLRERYPTLTPSDLKFCALLRMNMSTKEISRFTNLSVRGVETARYRLRKKFGLSASQTLAQFIMDFS